MASGSVSEPANAKPHHPKSREPHPASRQATLGVATNKSAGASKVERKVSVRPTRLSLIRQGDHIQ